MTLYPELQTNNEAFYLMSRVSIVIPVFNEGGKVSDAIKRIRGVIESYLRDYELLLVNDGSTDDTLTVLNELASNDQQRHIRVLSYPKNSGKGYAVRYGVSHSQGDVVIYLDGDLDISPDLIKEYIEKLNTYDLVIASKRHPSSDVTVPTSRLLLSRAFNFIVNMATGIHQTDTQVGLKVGKGDIMRRIFSNVNINRYAFDVELFTIASVLQLKVQEMPVVMKIDRQFNIKEIVNMFVDVTRICYKHKILQMYQKELPVSLPARVENNSSHYQ